MSSARKLTDWLGKQNLKQAQNCATYNTFFPASIIAMYSNSVENKIMVLYNFYWWDKDPLNSIKI